MKQSDENEEADASTEIIMLPMRCCRRYISRLENGADLMSYFILHETYFYVV